jgi:hypothetical protein
MPASPERAPDVRITPEQRAELVAAFYEAFMKLARERGGDEYLRMSALADVLPRQETLVVRRDDPARVAELIAGAEVPLALDAQLGEYANAIEWKPELRERGLSAALAEGMGTYHGLVTVWGARPNADVRIAKVPDLIGNAAGTDRSLIRSVQGTIRPEDVRFVTIRTPLKLHPEDDLSDDELDRKEAGESNGFVFRTIIFPEGVRPTQPKRSAR